jgi:hypothetical protein
MAKSSSLFKKFQLPIFIGGGSFFLITLLALLLPMHVNQDLFSTLDSVNEYALSFPEFPKRDNKNIIKPDYRTFYASNLPGFFSRTYGNLLRHLRILSPLPWSSDTFARIMRKLTKERETRTYKDLFIHKLIPEKDSEIVVWGDLQGAFHSLNRSLQRLKDKGLIDNNYKLKNDVYFVFLGDVVSRSPYIMETLMLVMRLMEKNPRQVFYLRGNHEANNYWQGYGLKKELKIKARHLKQDDKFPLRLLVQRFFNTLPLALYVGIAPETSKDFVRFSHEGGNEFSIEKLNLYCYSDFLQAIAEDPLTTYQIEGNDSFCSESTSIKLKAVIRAEIKRKSYQKMDGMRALAPEKGVPAWTFLSCPTTTYQEGVEFFYDAFGLIKLAPDLASWSITLNKQDVREKNGFTERTHNFISGQEL